MVPLGRETTKGDVLTEPSSLHHHMQRRRLGRVSLNGPTYGTHARFAYGSIKTEVSGRVA